MEACTIGSLKLVHWLIEIGADVNSRDKNEHTALWWNHCGKHSSFKKKRIQESLLKAGATLETFKDNDDAYSDPSLCASM